MNASRPLDEPPGEMPQQIIGIGTQLAGARYGAPGVFSASGDSGKLAFSTVNRGNIPRVPAIQGPGAGASTPIVYPGERRTLSVKLERPGEYQVVCALKGNVERGMAGSLRVSGAGQEKAVRRNPIRP